MRDAFQKAPHLKISWVRHDDVRMRAVAAPIRQLQGYDWLRRWYCAIALDHLHVGSIKTPIPAGKRLDRQMAARDRCVEPLRRPIDAAPERLTLRDFAELAMNGKWRSLVGPRWQRNCRD
jgi:hypothetical protein